MNRLPVLALAAALTVGGAGAAVTTAIAAKAPAKPASVHLRKTKLGKVLVNARGVTLYLFEADKHGKSACTGACAVAWPPLLTKGEPKAGNGVSSAKLGTLKRSDGTTQVTYNGHPLYRFIKDANTPGRTTGEGVNGFGAEWYVMNAQGHAVEAKG